ncbi:MAG: hypothetical protein M3O61_15635 [Gemmatimonadota bacterium]|nr:hypothetical protein [Gemmatimonadota bacterium]
MFIGTAWHVLAEYVNRKAEGLDVILVARDTPLEPPDVAFVDKPNDIAFLRLPKHKLPELEADAYDPGDRWPPRRVLVDDVVIFCGLPGYLRVESENSELLFGDFSICQPVTTVGRHHFVLHLERSNWESLGRGPLPAEDQFLGGLSGAPVFVMDDLSYPLVGIVSSIGKTMPLLYVQSLDHLPRRF